MESKWGHRQLRQIGFWTTWLAPVVSITWLAGHLFLAYRLYPMLAVHWDTANEFGFAYLFKSL